MLTGHCSLQGFVTNGLATMANTMFARVFKTNCPTMLERDVYDPVNMCPNLGYFGYNPKMAIWEMPLYLSW